MTAPLLLAPLPKHVVEACDLSLAQATKVAEAIVDATGLADAFEFSLNARTGAPRRVSWRTLLTVFVTAGIRGGDMLLTLVQKTAAEMLRDGLLPAKVSYCQLWDNLDHFSTAMDADHVVSAHNHDLVASTKTGEVEDCPTGCTGGRPITRELFAALLLHASSFPGGMTINTTVFALDSTDKETWAARQSWDKLPDIDQSAGAVRPEDEGEKVNSQDTFRTPGWPRLGYDGRAQHTVDLDAREGYRSGKNMRRKEVYIGFDEHIVTQVPEFGAGEIPHTALSLVTAPAGSDKAAAGILAVEALRAVGYDVQELLSDRGYTYLDAGKWANALRARDITQTFDLHKNQRGVRPGPIMGSIWVDGTLFTDAMPKHLRELPGFKLGLSTAEIIKLQGKYDQRIPYAFAPFGDVNTDRGTQRWRGPALRRLVRCVNDPESMRLGYDRPTTTCKPASVDPVTGKRVVPCGCSRTVTVSLDEYARERQPLQFGTTIWHASYGRRSAIEALNSELRTHRGMNFRRDWCRVRGAARTHALVTFGLVGVNVRMLRDWYTTRGQADPWMVAIGDTTDPDFAAVHARRTAQPRGTSLHVRVTTGDIPRRTEPRARYPFVPRHLRPKHLRQTDIGGTVHDTEGHAPPHQPG
ncbi:hypothetical protein [Cellulomonas soli]|uniref:Transposase n=1 Tax=Cellulomonas soli TaxID=931535 RepID=A0A512PIB4_9CELL|nr:hypothetical protein [Cellulomonas soli]NYI58666.1 hypothetical protein [Cellulomonas soli]GEP70948.1 hypothetical protein CSO01_36630 [Cellulomonas soli]